MAVTAPRADLSSDRETTERPAPLPAFSLDSNRRACARRRFERPDQDQRADATPLHQPATRARLPDAAGALHDVREFLQAAHRHHVTKLAGHPVWALPDAPRRKMAVPCSTAKFREETSKKADSAARAALLRRTT